jgi:hypothetical protein
LRSTAWLLALAMLPGMARAQEPARPAEESGPIRVELNRLETVGGRR